MKENNKITDKVNSFHVLFQIPYRSEFGESLHLIIKNELQENVFAMQYGKNAIWHFAIDLNRNELLNNEIVYSYFLKGLNDENKYEGGEWRKLDFSFLQHDKISILDQWNDAGNLLNIYNSSIFQKPYPLKGGKLKAVKLKNNTTHIFTINIPFVTPNLKVCLLGNGAATGSWTISRKCFLIATKENTYSIQLNLSSEDFPFEYKYVLYDTAKKSILQFENGENRLLKKMEQNILQSVNDGFGNFNYEEKKGVGVSIPIFSLRSENSGGVGEFNDLKLLGDWAEKTGIKLIQILPVNDTTATNGWEDSYPYSSISAFALHPMYLNLFTMAEKKFTHIAEKYAVDLQKLNALPEVNYPEVSKLKWNFFKEIFPLQKKQIFALKNYQEFFINNKFWLEPYAAFCFLRDKYTTADFYAWPAFKKYNTAAIKKILKKNESEISIHYFLQFHLHTQLLDAVNYLKKRGISLKADMPIGIKRESADHWQFPNLFNENLHAGAPPDAFTTDGQNWGFPTYNWEAMKENNYQWWEAKLNRNNAYAAAIRLDHILGFFRIWSIPKENTQGILGYFVPANALHENDFTQYNISFDEERFCKPFITERLLQNIFLEKSGYVKGFYLNEKIPGHFEFKEAYNTQIKLQEFILKRDDSAQSKKLLARLLHLHTEIILLKDPENGFHFRVDMQHTFSFNSLDENTKNKLNKLYHDYFFSRQNELWKSNGIEILSALRKTTNMLYCGEDLGWAPGFVPGVLKNNGILTLEVQRMPKKNNAIFTNLTTIPYVSVATPGTHDMPVLRYWWKQDENTTQLFYNDILKMPGKAPAEADGNIIQKIVKQFLHSPAMWCIFQWQDMVAIDENLRAADPAKERINDPANAENKWNYRIHISMEEMLKQNEFNEQWKRLITENNRN